MKLHLGVLDVPYSDGKATTGDVATILEEKYHVMETFADKFGHDVIAAAFAASARTAVEDMFSGAPGDLSLTLDATEGIEAAFRDFIDMKLFDGIIPGVPTQASLKGVNHRLKRPYAKDNPIRPSFKDTGLYEASMKAWTDD